MHWRLNDLDRDTWDRTARDAPLETSWAYGAVAASFGARVCRWRLVSGGHNVAIAQSIERRFGPVGLHYLPSGIHCAGQPDIDGLRRAVGYGRFLLSPDAGFPLRTMADRAELTIGRDMRERMSKKWRNRLGQAERAGLTVRRIVGVSGWLLRVETAQRRARGYRSLPHSWLRRMAAIDAQSVETYVVWQAGQRIAGMTFLRHGRQLRYYVGASTDSGRAVSAHNLALWHAMRSASDRGDRRIDLGLIDRSRLPGLTRFKLGTGADIVTGKPLRVLTPWAQARDGSQSTMDGNATSVAMVRASATKNGITPLNTS